MEWPIFVIMAQQDRPMARVIEKNIEALIDHRKKEEDARTAKHKVADLVSQFAGSIKFVYIHLVVFGLWIVINLGLLPIRPFDPTLGHLAMVASIEAIFLSAFVLITQNRMVEVEKKRADLDLQISLLAEHEITRVMKIVQAIAEHMKLDISQDPELKELSRDVKPEEVLETMKEKDKIANKKR